MDNRRDLVGWTYCSTRTRSERGGAALLQVSRRFADVPRGGPEGTAPRLHTLTGVVELVDRLAK